MTKPYSLIGILLLSATAVTQTTTSTTVSGAQPASSTTSSGANAPATLVVQGVKGGNDSANSGIAGQGSNPSITAGDGGDGTGTGPTSGGIGGSLTLATGNGGASVGTAGGASGGNMLLNLGAAGSVGSGNPGGNGAILLSAPNNTGNTAGGSVNYPLLCGPTPQGICLYWLFNNNLGFYNLLAWRDCTGGSSCPTTGNQVSGGLDDQGVRLANQGAIRMTSGSLTAAAIDSCLDRTSAGVMAAGEGTCGFGDIDNGAFQAVAFNVRGLASGIVDTQSGPSSPCTQFCVLLQSGTPFNMSWAGNIVIHNTTFTISAVFPPNLIQLTSDPSGLTNATYNFTTGSFPLTTDVTATMLNLAGAVVFNTGIGAISQIVGPSDQPLLISTPTGASGANAQALTETAGTGGAASPATTGGGNNGGSLTLNCGIGSAGGSTSGNGGAGGNCSLNGGTGGAAAAASTNGNGGNIVLTPGTAGAGAGAAGTSGQIQLAGSGGLSQSAVLVNGVPVTGGSGTTTYPLFSIWQSSTSGPSTWSTSGTVFGINAGTGFAGNLIDLYVGGVASLFSVTSGGIARANSAFASSTFRNTTNAATTFNGGIDQTSQVSSSTGTFRGGNVTGGTTASISGGAAFFQGGDNASTGGTETGGAATLRGGDDTGASGNSNTGGAVTIRGGNVTSTGTSLTPGAVSVTGGGLTGAATNIAGADVVIAGGLGTGNSQPAHVKLQEPSFSNTSGTAAQSQVTTYVVHKKTGSLTSGATTSMFQIPVSTNQTIGVEVIVHVETTQGTPHNCSTTETFVLAVQNTSSTITQTSTAGTTASICDAGTLTLVNTSTLFTTANPAVFKVAPSWTVIAPTAVIITVEVHNLSQQDITLL